MTVTLPTTLPVALARITTRALRPRYEGSNINTWIGFKHVNYLVEEAVLDHFRQAGLAARELYEVHALGLDLVSIDTRILTALHMDDEATAEVGPPRRSTGEGLWFAVTLTVERDGVPVKAVTSKVRVVLRADAHGAPGAPAPAELAPFVVDAIGDDAPVGAAVPSAAVPLGEGRGTSDDPVLATLTAGRNAFGWRWRMPYFYCHFTERVQMSGYLRQMEEVVDLFLADRGISIKSLLDDRDWIPVVPHASIELLGEALMEEDLYTVYTVEEIFKGVTYTSRMDCYVVRDGRLVQTATGVITHGYAVMENRRDWRLVDFDERVLRALQGPRT
jgi:acyl-CoA thioesterase FadM